MTDDLTGAAYAKAELGGAIELGSRPAILVVDLSRGFTDAECRLGSNLDDVVAATRSLLDSARGAGVPIIYTTVAYDSSGKDSGIWGQKIPALVDLAIGSKWVEIDPRLAPVESETVVTKKGASAFFGTNLSSILMTLGIDSVLLCGATTSGCVRATAIDLMQYGFPAIVPRECVGDRAPGPHEANLIDIQAKYADVVPVADAQAYLAGLTTGRSRGIGNASV